MRLKIGKRDEYFQNTSDHGCLVGYKTEYMTWEWTTSHEFIGFTVNIVFAPCLYTDFTLTCPGLLWLSPPAATKAPGCAFLYHRILSIASYRGIAQKAYVEVNFQNS